MSGHKPHTNKGLAVAAVLMCLGCGISFTQSSATPSPLEDTKAPDMFVAGNVEDSTPQSDAVADEDQEHTEGNGQADEVTETPVPTDTPTSEPTSEEQPVATITASPETSEGTWTPVGSNWYFMVNGTGYTGWLTDTDGHRYYFDENGVMQTGWLELDGNRYYLNADGVLQTGDITIDGQLYHFDANGVQQDAPADNSSDTGLIFYMNTAFADQAASASNTIASAAGDSSSAAEASVSSEDGNASAPEPTTTPEPTATPEPKGMIALTFDDGPSDFTDRLLDCLEANNAKATFFLVGQEIEYFQEPLSRMEALGCEIGNHSYDHTDLATLSEDDVTSQLSRTDEEIQNLVGHSATVVRPPYGSFNDTVAKIAARPLIMWSVDTLDWETQNADSTVQNVMDNAQDGAVILMHDIFKESVDAAEIFIPQLIQEGYELVTVSELAAAKGITLEAGSSYGSF